VLTFFDRTLFPLWRTYGAISGQKTPFGSDSHTLSDTVRKWVENTPPVGPRPAGCVSVIGPNVFSPNPNRWPPKKGNNFGQKKSTHPEISEVPKVYFTCGTRYVLTFVDRILFHIWRSYGAISGEKTPFGLDPHTSSPTEPSAGVRVGYIGMC
jgi:hypothetical protein